MEIDLVHRTSSADLLHAEIERLRDALLTYGDHTSHCQTRIGADRCDCGWVHLVSSVRYAK